MMDIDLTKLTTDELTELGRQVYREKEKRNVEYYKTLFQQFIHALNKMSESYPNEIACGLDNEYTWADLAEANWNIDMDGLI